VDITIRSNIKANLPLFKRHKIEKSYIFGSVVSSNFSENSDIDLWIISRRNFYLILLPLLIILRVI